MVLRTLCLERRTAYALTTRRRFGQPVRLNAITADLLSPVRGQKKTPSLKLAILPERATRVKRSTTFLRKARTRAARDRPDRPWGLAFAWKSAECTGAPRGTAARRAGPGAARVFVCSPRGSRGLPRPTPASLRRRRRRGDTESRPCDHARIPVYAGRYLTQVLTRSDGPTASAPDFVASRDGSGGSAAYCGLHQ
jgi:hypothetical protein